ncbi:MAG: sulfite exporter TauE/SafE family protein [Burkholderiaceae bacterium]
MNVPLLLIVELATLGLVTGFLAGLLGIGGGILLVPVVTWLLLKQGAAPEHIVHIAIASSLATICFTALSSVYAHHRRGVVLWPVVLRLSPGIALGAYLGAWITSLIPGVPLTLLFAVFAFFSAYQMFMNRKPHPARTLPGPAGMAAAGGGIGVLAGMVGAGGAFVSVPFMLWCNVAAHQAVGISAALGFPVAVAGTLGYVVNGWHVNTGLAGSFGYVYWPAVLVISLASVLSAPLGARVAARSSTGQLKKAFAGLLLVIGAAMALRGFGLW